MDTETWVYDRSKDAWKAASAHPDEKCMSKVAYVGGKVWAMSKQ